MTHTSPPDDGRSVLGRLRALADLRRWTDLETEARRALTLVSGTERADVFAHLARALLLQGRNAEAIDVAGAGLEIRAGDDWLGRVLASALVADGRLGEADRVLAGLLAREPGSYHVRVLAARIALLRDEIEEAGDHARAAITADSSRPGGYVMLAASYSQGGSPIEAETAARRGLRVDPNSGDLHCQLAVALERTGRRPEAAIHWVEAGRVGRYPEVAMEGLRHLMVDSPMHWLWAFVALTVFVGVTVVAGAFGADPWTTYLAGVAAGSVVSVLATPVLLPVARRRKRARARASLPVEARAVLDRAGTDQD